MYEIPFFGTEYLKSTQYSNWQTGDLTQKLGESAAQFAK
jgi:hypothetical protein